MGATSAVPISRPADSLEDVTVRSFLRWQGSKRAQADSIARLAVPSTGRYFEPFLGGGSVYFALRPDQAVLGDQLLPLILAYTAVRDEPESVIEMLDRIAQLDDYYHVRSLNPGTMSAVEQAAVFIYFERQLLQRPVPDQSRRQIQRT